MTLGWACSCSVLIGPMGCDMLAIGWLPSAPLQGCINQLCEEALATSPLPVERRLGEVGPWETSRSSNIATSPRNLLVVRYAQQRERLSQVLAASMRKLRRAQKAIGSYEFRNQIRRFAHPVSALRARHQRSLSIRRTVMAHGH